LIIASSTADPTKPVAPVRKTCIRPNTYCIDNHEWQRNYYEVRRPHKDGGAWEVRFVT
jgi:hypothetical protein